MEDGSSQSLLSKPMASTAAQRAALVDGDDAFDGAGNQPPPTYSTQTTFPKSPHEQRAILKLVEPPMRGQPQIDELLRTAIKEFLGSMFLSYIFVAAVFSSGQITNQVNTSGRVLFMGLAYGLIYGSLIYVISFPYIGYKVGHFNPFVTLALAIIPRTTKFEFIRLVLYWTAQFSGHLVGAILLAASTPHIHKAHLASFTLGEEVTWGNVFLMEMIVSFLFISVFLSVVITYSTAQERYKKHPPQAETHSLIIGLTLSVGVFVGGSVSGGLVNPALALSVGVASGVWKMHEVYWLGPLVGTVIASLLYGVIFHSPRQFLKRELGLRLD